MLFVLFILLIHLHLYQGAILECDFESPCKDFISDNNWNITNGLNPHPIDHDHTLNSSAGSYLYYNFSPTPYFEFSQIKTKSWIEPSIDRAICFRVWYYTSARNLSFTVQLVQGDDEHLARVVASISGEEPIIDDWTLINITLPNEQVGVYIRINSTTGELAFDDFSVDYCDEPLPQPSAVLFQCDFESSCSDHFASLPLYPYQWSIMKAQDATQIEPLAPKIDYTWANQSGHYALISNLKSMKPGNAGYLQTASEFIITPNESYCLNFQYYGFGNSMKGELKVYTFELDGTQALRPIWPIVPWGDYHYSNNQWTWATINLPLGFYSLVFYASTSDSIQQSFALDNIIISSCDYSPSPPAPTYSLLSFACNFDDHNACNMVNGDRFSTVTYNFTVYTGDTVPNRQLGPTHDHTSNSSTGGFLYWDSKMPLSVRNYGRVAPGNTIIQNLGMCLRFAYFVNSTAKNKSSTTLSLVPGGCYSQMLWSAHLDDSKGWQRAIVSVPGISCAETFYFDVSFSDVGPVSVAFDDIEIDQCEKFEPTTTTATTTTAMMTTTTTTKGNHAAHQYGLGYGWILMITSVFFRIISSIY